MSQLIVKKNRPLQIVLIFLLFNITFSMLIWFLLDASHWRIIKNRSSQSEKTNFLWQANQDIEKENKTLKEKIITFETAAKVDKQTASTLQNDIRSLQDQIYNLKRELDFYHGIMAATKNSKGLDIQGLHIVATPRERLFRFKLVLTNIIKNDNVIKVAMDISVEGKNREKPQVFSLKELSIGKPAEQHITIKNFKQIEGNILFPVGFKPLRVIVDLKQKGTQKQTINKIFEWSTITSEHYNDKGSKKNV